MVVLFLSVIFSIAHANELTEQEAYELGIEAYMYFHSIITMDVTRKVMTNLPTGKKTGVAPVNTFAHFRKFPDANFKDVVRPNFDTLYSTAWLDMTKEPIIISVPDSNDRYYLLPMLDMWSDVFASPGKRTSGTGEGHYAIVSKGWKGKLPKGVERIEAPTPYVWIIGRTQTNGPKDYKAVNKFQDGLKITPLSQWGKKVNSVTFKSNPSVDMKTPPAEQVLSMNADEYFSYGAALMTQHSPHLTDWGILQRLKRIGIVEGKSFNLSKAPANIQNGLKRAVADGLKVMQKSLPSIASINNGWQMNTSSIGVYGNYYLKRAIIAWVGLGANQPEDAIYPLNLTDADGDKVLSGKNYVLHFSKDELPPVNAFWSATMYNDKGFQVANKINRFAIGDRDELKFNNDGSLDIYIQPQSPGKDKEPNWLPSPDNGGVLGVTLRLYSPKAQALDGRWLPPAIKKEK